MAERMKTLKCLYLKHFSNSFLPAVRTTLSVFIWPSLAGEAKATIPEQSCQRGKCAQEDEVSADPVGAGANFAADAANASVRSPSLTRVDTL